MAGLALLDVGRPNPHLDREFPGPMGWHNPEHIDWVSAERTQTTLVMPVVDVPVLVVTAADGQSGDNDQSFWLCLSPRSNQAVMPGGHVLYQETPGTVAAAVLDAVVPS